MAVEQSKRQPCITGVLKPRDSISPGKRLYFFDNMRTALTALVIYHHTLIAYGGEGSWNYKSRYHPDAPILKGLNVVAQTFFMGSFFFISGYFSCTSLGKLSCARFLKTKLMRLGIPTFLYTLLARPLTQSALYIIADGRWPVGDILHEHWEELRGVQGPVWYITLLLIFDCSLAFCVQTGMKPASDTTRRTQGRQKQFSASTLVMGVLSCSTSSFLIRLYAPSTLVYRPLNLRIGYLPQYVFAYIFGARIANPESVLLLPSGSTSILLLLVFISTAASVSASKLSWPIEDYSGGINPIAACYAIWNEALGYLIFATWFNAFRQFANHPWRNSAQYSYAAFLLHTPISVAIEVGLDDWRADAVVKAASVGTINIFASFMAAWLLLQVPGIRSIL